MSDSTIITTLRQLVERNVALGNKPDALRMSALTLGRIVGAIDPEPAKSFAALDTIGVAIEIDDDMLPGTFHLDFDVPEKNLSATIKHFTEEDSNDD